MPFVALAALGSLVWKGIDFLKAATSADWNTVLTQLIVWVVGVAAVLLFAHSDFASQIAVGDATLATLGVVSQVIVGLMIASTASVANDFKKAFDNTDSAKSNSLLP